MRRSTFNTLSHIATAIAAVIIGGGVMTAGASSTIQPAEPTPVEPTVEQPNTPQRGGGSYGPDYNTTACASAPASYKYELFQSPNLYDQSYRGANDRMVASMVNRTPQNTTQPTYSYKLEIVVSGRMKITEVHYCMATVTTVYKGYDEGGMFPIYEYLIDDVQWVTVPVTRDKYNKSLYTADYPLGSYSFDESTGNSTNRTPVNYYIVGRGSGKSVPSTVTPFGPLQK